MGPGGGERWSMHAEFLESPVIFSRSSERWKGPRKYRKRKRPRVPASKHARALRGRSLAACVHACVRTVNDRRARTPQGHALTHVRAPPRARSRARARVSTLFRATTAVADVPSSSSSSSFFFFLLLLRLLFLFFFFFLFFSLSTNASFYASIISR